MENGTLSKIVHTEKKVEHWLNGELILSFVPNQRIGMKGKIQGNGKITQIMQNSKKDT